MNPIDYLGMMPQTDLLKNFTQGLQVGNGLREMQMKQQDHEQKLQRQQQYQTDIAAAMQNPTPQAFAALSVKYPEQREAFKQSWDMQSEADRRDQGGAMMQAYTAANAGRFDIVQDLLTKRIEARKNSGLDTTEEEGLLTIAKDNPNQLRGALGLSLSYITDPKDFATKFASLGGEQRAAEKAPFELAKAGADARKAGADATTAEVKAKYADSDALLELEKKGWDIKGIQADIDFKRQSSRIAAMNAALAREGNDLKRQELSMKIDDAIRERDTKVREKVANAEAGAANIDNMLNTVERILQNKSLNSVVGSLEGRAYYPNTVMGSANPFGDGDERADAIALIDTLGSQAFLAQIPNIKGMGALSNTEGEKLQSALQNLSRAQSENQFRANLGEAKRLLMKGRDTLSKSTGVPLGKPDTPAAASTRPPLDSFRR